MTVNENTIVVSTTAPTCQVVRPGDAVGGKQGLNYAMGILAQPVGATGICMHVVTIPPGGRANAHFHENHETTIYILSGESVTWFGEDLREKATIKAGEFFYIPAGMPHLPANESPTEPCVAVRARTGPNEQERVVLLPELDGKIPPRS